MTTDTLARPERFDLTMGFLGEPEAGELLKYIEALEVRALIAQALPAAEPVGYANAGDLEQMRKHGRGTLLWATPQGPDYSALYATPQAAQQAAQAPFTGIAARKLTELQTQGYTVNGYSLMHAETRARGFIDRGGFVGWWSNRDHGQAAQTASSWSPKFDAVAPEQERLSEAFSEEIRAHYSRWGSPPEPARILEMAEALYQAEATALPQPPHPDNLTSKSALKRIEVQSQPPQPQGDAS